MGYDPQKIKSLSAVTISPRINLKKALELGVSESKYEESIKHKKSDIQIRLEISIDNALHIENISLKKCNSSSGYNQVDKRPVSEYKKMWKFDNEVEFLVKLFTGEVQNKDFELQHGIKPRDSRRLFLDEIPKSSFEKIRGFFEENKLLVITDILRGRGGLSAEWFLVTRKNEDSSLDWILKDINSVCNFFSKGKVEMSPKGSLTLAKVTMQRKGGTPDPTRLQFKINPLYLFEI